MCSCANIAKQTAGAPASISCLCWLGVTLHPSEVTPALFHKVNLPLKTWYLQTRLIEIDGCMTFIEFFLRVGSGRDAVLSGLCASRMLFKLNSCSGCDSLSNTQAHTQRHRQAKRTDRQKETEMRTDLCNSELQPEAAGPALDSFSLHRCFVELSQVCHYRAYHIIIFDEIKLNYIQDNSFTVHK